MRARRTKLHAVRDRSRASFTADAACAARAHGALHPDPTLRNPDYLAGRFVGMPFRVMLWPLLRRRFMQEFDRRAAGVYVLHQARTKHIDAILASELDAGVAQVVVLGAGFDSRAYRFADRLKQARIFEVDHPATGAEKRRRVRRIFGEEPRHVTYVAVDFARDDLGERLAASGFAKSARTMFLWEGVTAYLTAPAIDAMLTFVAGAGAGSSIVFDYVWRSMFASTDPRAKMQLALAESYGEPYQFGVEPDEVGALVARNGLSLVSNVNADELTQRYLIGSDGRPWGEHFPLISIAHARV
jgi:methyltransferase (TIGR00027 family)